MKPIWKVDLNNEYSNYEQHIIATNSVTTVSIKIEDDLNISDMHDNWFRKMFFKWWPNTC